MNTHKQEGQEIAENPPMPSDDHHDGETTDDRAYRWSAGPGSTVEPSRLLGNRDEVLTFSRLVGINIIKCKGVWAKVHGMCLVTGRVGIHLLSWGRSTTLSCLRVNSSGTLGGAEQLSRKKRASPPAWRRTSTALPGVHDQRSVFGGTSGRCDLVFAGMLAVITVRCFLSLSRTTSEARP